MTGKKIDKKRQEQNRQAQKVFRERNQTKINELKLRLQELEEMKEIYEQANVNELMALRRENNTLKQQRLVMISQIDKLRQDNLVLTTRTRTRPKTIPRQLPVKGMPSCPLPWTSHKHTFIDSASNQDSNSVSTRSSDDKRWHDPHQYPGFPQWAPPSTTRKNLLPQPTPLHLYTREPVQPPTVPTPHMEMFNQVNQNYGGGSRPLQSTPKASQNLEPFFMPFLPSTNAMVPLYHHMPFENTGSNAGMIFDNFNDWFDYDQLGMPLVSREMGFEPLEVMLGSAISNPMADLEQNGSQAPGSQSYKVLDDLSPGLGRDNILDCDLDIRNIMTSEPPSSAYNSNPCSSNTTKPSSKLINGSDSNTFLLQDERLGFQDLAHSHQLTMDEAAKLRLADVFLPM